MSGDFEKAEMCAWYRFGPFRVLKRNANERIIYYLIIVVVVILTRCLVSKGER